VYKKEGSETSRRDGPGSPRTVQPQENKEYSEIGF
jgi:hypothetical protein